MYWDSYVIEYYAVFDVQADYNKGKKSVMLASWTCGTVALHREI